MPPPTPSVRRAASGASATVGLAVLGYHRIIDTQPAVGLAVASIAFADQLRALRAGDWRTITAAALGALIKAHDPWPRHTVVITFDDGRIDSYSCAYPLLLRYGFVATFYIITGRVGRASYVTWDELAAMARHGMEIGNHTVDHPNLRTLHGPALVAQIADAATAIRQHLAARGVTVRVTTFAYPDGATSAQVHAILEAEGYTVACTVTSRIAVPGDDPLYLPRVRVNGGESTAAVLAAIR